MDNGYNLQIQQTRLQAHVFALAVEFDYRNGDDHFARTLTFAAEAFVAIVAVD